MELLSKKGNHQIGDAEQWIMGWLVGSWVGWMAG